ncbi:hypothetical protein HS088_TW13G00176 [Tripterygium wilfordii]|uniref:DUF599 domain-containing protein n=1 Tax=Tripterygium wilfordii TaxID=458696 RepID=A0A7J7CT68_TRIWF|nr:uncharacterized protein LOC120011727 [Tripterygium wilfordii]KAF5737297.1 hypothetical protein HS088_TW13G00176 [Tripterygium wilfordii]
MATVIGYLDSVLPPMSLFLMIGYHAYLWQCFKHRQSQTTLGIDALMRNSWFSHLDITQANDKKGMLAVQSLRNTLMATILTATVAILINGALAALTNNSYTQDHLFKSPLFGSRSGTIYVLKFGSASICVLLSFLCSSMAVRYLIDASFLINALGEFSSVADAQLVLERGFMLATVGNRMLCVAFPMVIWLFGPIPMAMSTVALVWGLHELDFAPKLAICDVKKLDCEL